ncbi:MAG TPA: histidine--tRNA ligase [Chitinophagaceae bacterium]|mgnify:CR=1 FL=1|nr:histidine--tRNA ligase [Chitinophagaceae bacterium]MCB9054411.1 histidine--tRNA ligase [Chitinophagales bacterium]HRX94141.1 histidine--tRNA ligase [Chitinophagaceae bacterium]
MSKPSIPQGTRDFGPDVVQKRNFILNTIRSVFELYGFQPLETPAMENIETLMGKYGDEGDKLIFKILNNGLDNPDKEKQVREDFEKVLQGKNVKGITERALKYDLTIPFARYVAMNHNQLTFPFKRYQVQPVWRADRPQKGRYREFYQCDADVVGSESLLNELELANIYHDVFAKLGLSDYKIKINSRNVLVALAELCGGADKMTDITVAIDKLDKIGLEKVKNELAQKGLATEQIIFIEKYLKISGSNIEIITGLQSLIGHTDTGDKGIKEISYLLQHCDPSINISVDPTLARGLNYYTGIIFEVAAPKEVKMGSIGGGGRYDNLTGTFGVPGIAGVGISFGVDRIYDVMEELDLFPDSLQVSTKVLFFNLGDAESKVAFALMQQLRNNGISCELFHENIKFDKQFKYAEKKNIPNVVIIGSKELEENTCTIKNLQTGKQETIPQASLMKFAF